MRTFALFVLLLLSSAAVGAQESRVTGVVVDESGRPVPRALVEVGDNGPAESAFTNDRGEFTIGHHVPALACEVRASLTGFIAANARCTAAPLTLVLKVAPVSESIVVSATRNEAPADQVGASVTTFTRGQLDQRQAPLVADVLRSAPGAIVVRTGAPGAVASLFVRGGESTYNKVLVDGIPLNEPGGTFFFNNLTTENLERIEVVAGPQSALFGSDAMASVVQLFTKRGATTRPTGTFTGEGGSYDTFRGTGSVSGQRGHFDYSLGAARFSSSNRVPNSDFDNNSFSSNVGVSLGSGTTLRAITRAEFGTNGVPGQTAFARPDLDAFAKRNDGTIGVVFDQQATAGIRQHAIYSLAVSNQQSTNLTADPPYTARFGDRVASFPSSDFLYDSRTKLRRHHASYQADVQLANGSTSGNQLLTALIDWDGERASLQDLRAQTTNEPSRDNVGISVQHQAIWPRIVASGSARFEHNASFGSAAVPRGSLVIVVHEPSGTVGATRVHVSGGLGIKEPTLLQSFSPSPFFKGNPDLEAERSRGVEAGIEQRFAADRAKIAATWFHNRFENLISTSAPDPVTFAAQFVNIGVTRARGAEFTAEAAPLAAVRLRAGYTFLDSEILESTSPSSPVLKQGQPLFRRPRHSGFADVTFAHGPWSASVSGVFIGRFIDSDFASLQPAILENPGHNTWDARAAYALTRQVSATLAVDNVTDLDYMEPLGYQALRRAVRAGVRVGF